MTLCTLAVPTITQKVKFDIKCRFKSEFKQSRMFSQNKRCLTPTSVVCQDLNAFHGNSEAFGSELRKY